MSREFDEETIKEFMLKYEAKLKEGTLDRSKKDDLQQNSGQQNNFRKSREYQEFKSEYMPRHLSLYEKCCNISETVLKFAPSKEDEAEYLESIEICHLNVTPIGVNSFALLAPLVLILVGFFFAFFIPMLMGVDASMFFMVVFLIAALMVYIPLRKLPHFLANSWRMQASNQMVLCVFYIVTYMRQSSNLENAIDFAAEHLSPPLSLDLKKVIWNVETQKYESIGYALDVYLTSWKKWNLEFIEAMHLVESSLYESSNDRRLAVLDKALEVILEETYEKMLHFAHDLKSPITALHMLGIILPVLGLVILPLVVSFMSGVKWYNIAVLYNLFLPIVVYLFGKNILAKRPSGYGQTDVTKNNPELEKYQKVNFKFAGKEYNMNPLYIALIVGGILVFIGLIPLIMHFLAFDDVTLYQSGNGKINIMLLEYKTIKPENGIPYEDGPFGFGAALLSLFVPLGIGLGIGLYYRLNSKNVIKIRNQTKELEKEFAAAMFQLGNRIGDGIPTEIAFSKVAEIMEGTVSGKFFEAVSMNIQKTGMSVEEAIFHPKYGAINSYPSPMIESSMKILVQSIKKSPQVTAQALMNISRYIKEMHAVEERLNDLLSDSITSMQSQIKFMAPVISGIVIGITSMVSSIIGKLTDMMSSQKVAEAGASSNALSNMFQNAVPTYYFQMIVGIYVVQLVLILTILVNGIENGSDDLARDYNLGVNMIKSVVLYVLVAFVIMAVFNFIAMNIMPTAGG